MKKILLIALLFSTAVQASAQKTYQVKKNSGTLLLVNLKSVTIQGYEGKEILINVQTPAAEKKDDRANGLKAFGNTGYDNTGLGLTIKDKGQDTEITQIDQSAALQVEIKIPHTMSLSISNNRNLLAAKRDSSFIILKNVKSEVTAKLEDDNVKLENVTGPITISTMFGNIEGILQEPVKGPFSIVTLFGFIDLTLPGTIKANLTISSMTGGLYASDELNIKPVAPDQSGKVVSSNIVNGTMNGGGEALILKSSNGKIYLRKK